jgi:hypothetical protein
MRLWGEMNRLHDELAQKLFIPANLNPHAPNRKILLLPLHKTSSVPGTWHTHKREGIASPVIDQSSGFTALMA